MAICQVVLKKNNLNILSMTKRKSLSVKSWRGMPLRICIIPLVCYLGLEPSSISRVSARNTGHSFTRGLFSSFSVRPFGIRRAEECLLNERNSLITPLCASKRYRALLRSSFCAITNAQRHYASHFSSWLLLPSFRNRTGGGALSLPAEPIERDIKPQRLDSNQ